MKRTPAPEKSGGDGALAGLVGVECDVVVLGDAAACLFEPPDALPDLVGAFVGAGFGQPIGEPGEGGLEALGEALDDGALNIEGRTICALGDAAAWLVQGFLRHFRDEFQYHVDHGDFPPGVAEVREAA